MYMYGININESVNAVLYYSIYIKSKWWCDVGLFQPYTPLHPNSQLRVETLKRRKGRKEVT